MVMIILAIDPGITGALAFYDLNAPHLAVHDMPIVDGDVNASQLHFMLTHLDDGQKRPKPQIAIIERVHPHPKEGVSSVWRFASAYTTARVVVQLLGIPAMLASPAKWKKALRLQGGSEGKEQARRMAIEAFPDHSQLFSRKKDHNRAEAALLAFYASTLPTIRNHHDELRQG
jgi:hypothetical protein